MIISVQFKNKKTGEYEGRAYAFYCDIEDLQIGDIVKAPTTRGSVDARVFAVNVMEAAIDKDLLAMLKTITERAGEEDHQMPIAAFVSPAENMTSLDLEAAADIIRVKQLPIIEEQLRSVKLQVEAITQEAAAMVCTEDTIQTVKTKRAELNKMFSELEDRRKEVKTAVMGPYEQFDAVYKECISGPFKRADAALKEKVDDVEGEMKRQCEENLRIFFDGLLLLHNVDFITYEQAGIKIDMASARAKTPHKLRDKLNEFVATVAEGVSQIRQMDDRDEIMTEYKKCLDVGKAVAIVQERHRRIEEERKAAEAREEKRKRQEEAVAKVEAVVPPVTAEPPKPAEKIFPRFTFTVINATKSQLIKVREFMKQEGIQYE